MLPASRSGNTSTLARPATGPASFIFFAATAGLNAASACISPSIASSGARRARDGERAHDLVDMRVRGAALGRERQQRDARFLAQHAPAARGGRERDVGERLGRRIGIHRAIGKDQRALREEHEEEARRRGATRCEADRHHSRLDHSRGRARGTGDHRVGVANAQHEASVEQRLGREAARDLRVGFRASFEIGRGVGVEPIAALRVREQDRRGQVPDLQLLRRRDDSLVVMLGEDYAKAAAANLREACLQDVPPPARRRSLQSRPLVLPDPRDDAKPGVPSGSITATSPSAR